MPERDATPLYERRLNALAGVVQLHQNERPITVRGKRDDDDEIDNAAEKAARTVATAQAFYGFLDAADRRAS